MTRIPPSGKTIILQTECHALQTADKKTVTTVGWGRRDRGEREHRGRRTVKNKGKKSGEEKRFKFRWHPENEHRDSYKPCSPSLCICLSLWPVLISFHPPHPTRCSLPPLAAPMLRLQMLGPHSANLISLAV